MKIVVLAGGTSTERDVSIVSGTGVCKALRKQGHQAILIDVFFGCPELDPATAFEDAYDADAAAEGIRAKNVLLPEERKRRAFFGKGVLEVCAAADIVFMALHGANGEDGRVQAALELFGIRFTGTDYLSSAIAMSKELTKQFFLQAGVPVPRGISLQKGEAGMEEKLKDLTYPLIVKPNCGGSSVGVEVAQEQSELPAAIEAAFSYENEIVIEEFIAGREFSVGVVDGEAYPVIEIAPKQGFYNYENKYNAGMTVETCPAQLTEEQTLEMQRLAVLGANALGIRGYCRLDFLMKENGDMYCLEANTLPGMTPTSLLPQEAAALGISYEELCEKLVQISMGLNRQ